MNELSLRQTTKGYRVSLHGISVAGVSRRPPCEAEEFVQTEPFTGHGNRGNLNAQRNKMRKNLCLYECFRFQLPNKPNTAPVIYY